RREQLCLVMTIWPLEKRSAQQWGCEPLHRAMEGRMQLVGSMRAQRGTRRRAWITLYGESTSSEEAGGRVLIRMVEA
ncbi:MAG TPA: hypothetical protein VGX92_07350, partial [Pyrinomonadaceae bacterium]|nr:hypothetical protein [Pyrinomonadaceae bacterium]